jgi:hypothetical protein
VFFIYLIVLVISQRGGSLSSLSGIATALLGAIINPSSKAVPGVRGLQRQLNVWKVLVGTGILATAIAAIFLFPAGYDAAGGAFVAAGAGLAGLLTDTSSAAAALRSVARGESPAALAGQGQPAAADRPAAADQPDPLDQAGLN